jgi:D-hydroxyproline dehydrogenase subunit gamma
MGEAVELSVNGRSVRVLPGTTVAVALLSAGETMFRRSVSGEPRAPVCGMGICFECRVTIDGEPQVRGCQVVCRPGMDVRTDE